jgi:HK97 gp10 family phage protein
MRPPTGQAAGRRVALNGSKLWYSRFVELGTSKQPARSCLRRALDENGPAIRAKIETNLRGGIDREAARQHVPEDFGEVT